jgi:hypothetical protein
MDVENLKDEATEFFSKEGFKQHWSIYAVVAVFLAALYVRYLPAEGMKFLQALDPYFIFRRSQHLAYAGSMPATDFMTYFPYNAPTYLNNLGEIAIPAVMWWFGGKFFFSSYLEYAQFLPALFGALSTVAMYFFGKELFDRKVGISAAFLLAVTPGVLRRSSAGFFEKEPVGTFFMMLTFYFFTRAWKREDYLSGMLSGVSLALFTISWGGSQMMWLLLPLTVGAVIFLDQDIRQLVVAYTPTVLIGGGAAYALNYNKFSITGALFVVNLGMLGLLWSRYLVEEFELISEDRLKYYIPGMSGLGVIALLLSPLYSSYLTGILMKFLNLVDQTSGAGGVIGTTVAENQAPGVGQIISSMGATAAGAINPILGATGNLLGAWPLMMIGAGILGTTVFLMVVRRFGYIGDEVSDYIYFSGFEAVLTSWTLLVTGFFLQTYVFGIAAALTVMGAYLAMIIYMEDEMCFKLTSMIAISGTLLQALLFIGNPSVGIAVLPPVVLALGAVIMLYYTQQMEGMRDLEINWVLVLPLFWVASNLLGSLARSRLIFLSTFSVAFIGGYGLKKIIDGIEQFDLQTLVEVENPVNLKYAGIVFLLGLAVLSNGAAGYMNAQSVGGSPNQAWDTSLNYMDEETPPGSTIMSWWDYGYHFESIGRRASIANGWNAGYYTEGAERAVNMPLADFLTSDNPLEREGLSNFLDKHSVDYVVLDQTMIGKYSAVSTISNKAAQLPNETVGDVQTMNSLQTSRNIQQSMSQSGNSTTVTYQTRGVRIGVPVEISDTGVEITDAPLLRQQTSQGPRTVPIDCVITEDGEKNFDVDSQVPYCVAQDPYFNLERGISSQLPARLVLVPKAIKDSTLVELYLGDGAEVSWAEKIPEASNDYVKMWEVTETG